MAAAHQRERRFGRAEHAHRFVVRRRCAIASRVALGAVPVVRGDHEAREPAERRIVRLLAQLDLGRVERLAVAEISAFITGCSG